MGDLERLLLDEADKALGIAIENITNGKYEEALRSANKARLMNPELPGIKGLVTMLKILSANPDTPHYEILGVEEAANENEISSAFCKLLVDLNLDTNMFPKAYEAFFRIFKAKEVLSNDRLNYDRDLAVARKARPRVAKIEAVSSKDFAFDVGARARRAVLGKDVVVAPECQAHFDVLGTFDGMNTKSMADLNKDEAIKALEIAKENTINGKYDEALKSANYARLLNPELTDIEKLVTLLQVLSAKPYITHYEILRVEETASVNEISRAYLKLSVELNPDTNNFPKASEAYRRISVAMKVLSHDRLNYDKVLAVAREARSQVAEFEPLRIQDFAFDGLVSSMHTMSMANFNKDEANKAEEEPSKTLIGIRARDQARKRVAKFEVDIAEIEAIYKDFVFDLCARAIVAKDFLGYREALARAAAECEALARTLDGTSMIYSRELQKKKAVFQEKKAAFEAQFDTDLLVDREAPPRAAEREVAATTARESADRQAAPQEDSTHDVAAREDDASFVYIDPITGISYFTESFSTDSSSADTDSSSADTDSSSADTDSSTNASFTDDVGPGSKRASDAQSTSTPHTPKKRRDH